MARIKADYDLVKRRFPQEVSQIENKIRRGKSKYNNDAFDSFDWNYDYCISIKSNSFSGHY